MKNIYFILCLFLVIGSSLFAQNGTANINGIVTSESGDALLGANILIVHLSSGDKSGAVTDELGKYILNDIAPGQYSITASYVGYKKEDITSIQLLTGETKTYNFKLNEDNTGLGEIVVVARKRAESLYDVPMSLSAFGIAELATLNATDMFDIGKNVPNFTVNNFGNGNLAHAGLFIRGIGTQDHWISTDPGVGTYLDGVYLGRQMGANLNLLNIKQVEVARGPQGTLFGRNSLGGAVNFITRKPDDNPYTKIAIKAGSLERFSADFYTSQKLGDKVGVSLSGSFNRRGGIGEFILVDDPKREIGEMNEKSLRVALSYKPIDDLSFLLTYDTSGNEYGQQPYFLELYPGSFLEGFTFADDPDDSASLARSIQEATYDILITNRNPKNWV